MTTAGVPNKGGARKAGPSERRAIKAASSGSTQRVVKPSWWHRGHPVFTPLAGFFTGLVFILVLPTTFAYVLRFFLPDDAAGGAYWVVLLTFLIPVGLMFSPRTRRFGRFMWLGIVLTAVVVICVAGVVVWWITRQA
ncbi:MAG: hypothetical protein ACSLEW_05985 [Nocardioides sp.]